MVADPLTALAAMILATCRYLHIAACYVTWATTLAAAMVYFGYSFYDIIKRDTIRNAYEMQQLSNTVSLGNNDVDAATRRLEQDMKRRTWKDTWQPRFDVYKDIAKDNSELTDKVENAGS